MNKINKLVFLYNLKSTVNNTIVIVLLLLINLLNADNSHCNQSFFIDNGVDDKNVLEQGIANRSNLNEFNLFSHGEPGRLLINERWLDKKGIVRFLKSQNLPKDIVNVAIFGCEFAQGQKGMDAVRYIENVMNLKVLASTDITGINGNWNLEIGNINYESTFKGYSYDLQTEICDNGIDDDGDGYIDSYDSDCTELTDCYVDANIDPFTIVNRYETSSAVFSNGSTPMAGDIDGDGRPEIVAAGRFGNYYILEADGSDFNDTSVDITIPLRSFDSAANPSVAIADVDDDGDGEIIAHAMDGHVYVFAHTGGNTTNYVAKSDLISTTSGTTGIGSPRVSDIDEDGVPEVIVGKAIYKFNSSYTALTRVVAFESGSVSGHNAPRANFGAAWDKDIVVKDVLPNVPGKEFIAGSKVWSVDFVNNTLILQKDLALASSAEKNGLTISATSDGPTAVADIDLDGDLDIVYNENTGSDNSGKLVVWSPSDGVNGTVLFGNENGSSSFGNGGGLPTITNVYNDLQDDGHTIDYPEIFFVESSNVEAFNYGYPSGVSETGNKPYQLWSFSHADVSSVTSLSAFDFNGDDLVEIIYKDQTQTRILNGNVKSNNLPVLASFSGGSGTWSEGPIIGDWNSDDEANIAVVVATSFSTGKLTVFGSGDERSWVDARNIWNQRGYNVVNINGDLTVPTVEQNSLAFFPPDNANSEQELNIYNAQIGDQLLITPPGKVAAPDLVIGSTNLDQGSCPEESKLIMDVVNSGDEDLIDTTYINVYDSDPTVAGATLLYTQTSDVDILKGQTESISLNYDFDAVSSESVFIVVNTNASMTVPITNDDFADSVPECDFTNNIFEAATPSCCQGSTDGIPTASDSDGDGVNDGCDLDDDNDGILDADENCVINPVNLINGSVNWPETTNNTVSVATTTSGANASINNYSDVRVFNVGQEQNIEYEDAVQINADANTNTTVITYTFAEPISTDNFGIFLEDFDRGNPYGSISVDTTLGGEFGGASLSGSWPQAASEADFEVQEVIRDGETDVSPVFALDSNGEITFPTAPTSTNRVSAMIVGKNSQVFTSFTLTLNDLGNSGSGDNIRVYLVPLNSCNNDFDGDGIPNKYDLDSDGDGCPDVVEGGGAYTNANLVTNNNVDGGSTNITQNLGTSSNNDGTPNLDNDTITSDSQQALGNSQNNEANTECCSDASNYSNILDSDGDDIGDDCDLDDDNDGILDSDECSNDLFVLDWDNVTDPDGASNVDFTDVGGSTVDVNLTTVFYGGAFTGLTGIPTSPRYNSGLNGSLDLDIWGRGIDSAQYAEYILTFSEEVLSTFTIGDIEKELFKFQDAIKVTAFDTNDNPVTVLADLGGSLSYNSESFIVEAVGGQAGASPDDPSHQANFTINTPVKKIVITLGLGDGGGCLTGDDCERGLIHYRSYLSDLNLVLVGCDIDGDGISNTLDLDSDGDGCPDAIEGGGDFTADNLSTSTIPGGNTDGDAAYTGGNDPVTDNLTGSPVADGAVGDTGIPVGADQTSGQGVGGSQIIGEIEVTTQPEDQSICEDALSGTVTFNAEATATPADGLVWQWEMMADGETEFIEVSGAAASGTGANASLTVAVSNVNQNNTQYQVVFTSTAMQCPVYSNTVNLIVISKPNAGVDQTIGCFSQDTATMAGTGTGTWSLDAANSDGTATIANTTSPTTTVTGFSATGTYTLIWTAANGCTDTVTINAGNACVCTNPPSVNLSDTSGATCGITPITVTGNTFGGYATEVTLTENGLGSLTATSATSSPFEFTYTPVASDAGNSVTITVTTNNPNTEGGLCEAATATYTLDINANPTVDAGDDFTITCVDNTDGLQIGEAQATGYNYSWTPTTGLSESDISNPTANPTLTTTYTVTKTEIATGCFATDEITVTVNNTDPTVSVSSTDETAVDANDGTLTATPAGGSGSYSFLWSQTEPTAVTGLYTTQSVSNVSPGTYSVTVTDTATGCTVSTSVIVGEYNCNTAISFGDPTITNITCNGSEDGEAIIDVTAVNGPLDAVLTLGTTVISTDTLATDATNLSYAGLDVGSYTVTLTDDKGCEGSTTFTITQPTQLVATASTLSNQETVGGTEGSVTVATPTTGTADYTYSWNTNPVQTTQTATGLLPGDYTVTVTDANGCTATSITTVQPINCDISLSATSESVDCKGDSVTATATTTGGTMPFSYAWTNDADDSNVNVDNDESVDLPAGSYTIIVTDDNGCTATTSLTITEPSALSLSMDLNQIACFGDTTGSIDLTVSGGTADYSYSWTKDGAPLTVTSQDLENLGVGVYEVTVTDANGCSDKINDTITQPDAALTANATSTNETAVDANDGTITASPTGGTGVTASDYTYSWSQTAPTAISGLYETQSVTGVSPGTYEVLVTDLNGCTTTESVIVGEYNCNTAISFGDPTITNITCNGSEDGEAIIDVTAVNGPLDAVLTLGTTVISTDTLATDATNLSYTGLDVGSYTVTLTDDKGCEGSTTFTITQPTQLVATASTLSNQETVGGTEGSVTVATPTTGTADYTYSWNTNPVQTTQTATGLLPGDYTVTVTDANGCRATSITTVQPINCDISLSATSESVDCKGDSVTATATTTGGTMPFSYAWTNDADDSNVNVDNDESVDLPAGSYTIIVTDDNGCTATTSLTIAEPSALSLSMDLNQVACFGDTTGSIDLTVSGGTADYSYSWTKDGAPLTVTSQDLENLGVGVYEVTVTDANGCSDKINDTITQPDAALTANATSTNETAVDANDGTITASPTGGTGVTASDYTYSWSQTAPTAISGLYETQSVTGVSPGTYEVLVTDLNGCTTTESVIVGEYNCNTAISFADPTITNITCNGSEDGEAIIDVTAVNGPLDAVLTLGTTVISTDTLATDATNLSYTGLDVGSYTVTVTDDKGCEGSTTFTITQPTQLVATASTLNNQETVGGTEGSVTVATPTTGTADYTYSWNTNPVQTTQTATGLLPGDYTVTVTDANGCTATSITTVQPINCDISLSATSESVDCKGDSVTATATTTGGTMPFSYAWTNDADDSNVNVDNDESVDLPAGSYTIIVTDDNGCTATTSLTITEPSALSLSMDLNQVACFGDTTGSIDLTVSGGTADYSYSWTKDGAPLTVTSQDLENLGVGVYEVTVTDANGCSDKINDTITQPDAALTANATSTNETAVDANDGTITASPTGGTGVTASDYTYSWSQTAPTAISGLYETQSVTGVSPGTYEVLVTDLNGCTTTESVIVGEYNCNTAISFGDPTITNITCNGSEDGEAIIDVTAVNGPLDAVLTLGTTVISTDTLATDATNLSYTGLDVGSYTVTVTDDKGCEGSTTFTITQPTQLVAAASTLNNQETVGGTEGSVTVATPTTGTADYSYSWNTNPVQTTQTATGLLPGDYTVTVTDANGCTVTSITTVQPINCDISLSATSESVDCKGDSVTATATTTGGTMPFSYAWTNDADDSNVNVDNDESVDLPAGSYTIIVTDDNGCTATTSLTITEPSALSLSMDLNQIACFGDTTGSIDLTVSGGTADYSYSWTKDGAPLTVTSQDLENLGVGVYEVTVTDANGCSDKINDTITQPDAAVEVTLNNKTDITCDGNAVITINQPTGGTGTETTDYTYSWVDESGATVEDEGDANPLTFEVNEVGTYTLTVRDLNSCIDTLEVTIDKNNSLPVLTLGEFSCDSATSTYGVGYFTNGGTPMVTNALGVDISESVTVGANEITGIPFGTDVSISVGDSNTGCSTSIGVDALTKCPTNCVFPNLTIGQPVCDGVTANTYTVNYEETSGATISITTANGTVSEDGDGIIQVGLGNNITVIATNGDCIVSYDITSPINCDDPCSNPSISIGGTECGTNGDDTYSITYSVTDGATVTSSLGDSSVPGIITGVPSGTDAVLTVVLENCTESTTVTVPAAECPECQLPTLTLGNVTCDATGYSVEVISNSSDIDSTGGTPSGTMITGIGFGDTITITAGAGSCTTSIDYTAGIRCSIDCVLPDLTLGQPVCNGQGATTYTVSYTENTGATISTTGTDNEDGTITADIGDNITVTATNGNCIVTFDVTSPANCDDPCGNPLISIGGTECTTNGDATYSVYYTVIDGATVSSTLGDSSQVGIITGIASGADVTLTVTYPGCPETTTVIVPAADCPVCQLPTLTLGNVSCDATGYSIEVISNSTDISIDGTPSSSMITGIGFGQTVTITAGTDTCTTSIDYTAGTDCFSDCNLPDLTLGQPVCNGQGATTYTVSYTVNSGATISTTGTDNEDGTITADIGDNITVTATSGDCVVSFDVTSPESCDDPCDNPLISIGGTDCAIDGSATYNVYYTAITGATVSSSTGDSSVSGVISGISSGTDVILTVTFPGCPETTTVTVPAPMCPECVLPILTVGTTECEGTTYAVSFNSNGTVTANVGTVGTDSITNIPLGTDVIITSTTGDCSVSVTTTGLADPCDPDCNDLPGLVTGQPICGADGEYVVNYTVEDSSAVVTITGGTDDSGTVTATLGDTIVISVTNDCGTEGITITSDALNCPDNPCSNPAISISGTDCATDGSAFYTVSFTVSAGTTVVSTLGDVNVSEGTITNIPSGENVTITATLEDCTESQSTEITAPMCPECVLPMLTVGTTECEGTTYAVSFNSNGTVTSNVGTVGTDSITNIPLGTDVIITSTTGDCSVSVTTTGLADPCDPDCNDLPGLVTGQPICGADGEYVVNYTVEDSNAVVTITGGTDDSGTVTATLGDTIVISVTNDCGTEGITITSDALNCPDTPCSNPAISISGTDCATDGSAFYTVSFTASAGTTVTSTLGDVNVSEGTITNIPSGENVTITATLADCTESQSTEITAPMCPECVLPILTVGTTECEGTTYAVSFNSNGTVTSNVGTVGTDSITNIPLGTDVIITSTTGDCSVSVTTTGLADPCDPDCNDLPGLVTGQPICGADGEYVVNYTVEDSSAVVTITGGTDDSGTVTATLGDTIVISVTNDCGTEGITITSDALNCPDTPCSNPAISISGTDCATDGSAFYTVSFTASAGTTVVSTLGDVNVSEGTITNIPSGENVTITATLADCTESQSTEITAPMCPECVLPMLTVGTTECEGTTYAVSFNSNGTVTSNVGTVGTDSITNIPLGTDVIITSTTGDCSVSVTTTGLADPCDPDCNDLPGLVTGQPICGADGEYVVNYTVEDSSAVVTITGGTDDSGTVTATLGDTIVISVTNDCGTEGITITSDALNCPDTPCSNPAISISGTDCATDGSAFYTVSFTASAGTTVVSTLGDVNVSEGTITNIPSGENVTITATLADCTESQSTEITAPMCPECVLPILTVGTTECEGTTYAVSFNSNGTVTSNVGTVGTDSITNIPLGTDVIITSTTGDCSVSVTTTGLADPCDPDCNDLPGLVTGQPICGADGEYVVNYTVEDSSAVVTITGGTDDSGTVTATLGDTIVISVTNDCGTEGITITSDALNCPDNPCSNPAISISGTDCATDGSAFYTVSFTVSAGTTVVSTLGDVNVSEGTITNIPSGENVTITATLADCTESQSTEITAPMCPECVLPILTVGTTECEGTTYAVSFNSNGTVTSNVGTVGTDSITNIPLGTDVIITSTTGDCSVSVTTTGLADPCDPDCNDLPGLVTGQPICGADGEYVVNYTVEDSSAVVTITGGTDDSGTVTATLGDTIVISVTNDCGTEGITITSDALDCPDNPCSNPAISISGTDCATDGSAFYTVSFTASAGTTVVSTLGDVNVSEGTITNIPSGENVTITATLADCTESQSVDITAPMCPECVLPMLTVGTTECEGTTYAVSFNSNGTVTSNVGTVGTDSITNIPLGTDVIITSTTGDCSVSVTTTGLADPCDPDCNDLPGLVTGQPICGADGEYVVNYTVEDSNAVVTITGGTDDSGTVTATLGDIIVISVTNDCGTEGITITSDALDCPDTPCSNPAISISGTDCATDGSAFYTVSFTASAGTTVVSTLGDVNVSEGTITNIPSGENVTITATLADCTESQSVDITAPMCPECVLPMLTVGTTECEGTTYAVSFNSNGTVTSNVGTVGTDSITNIPLGTDVIITSTTGDCSVSVTTTGLADPCDPDCNDLPGLVTGQPICGADGEYVVNYTVEDSNAVVTITGGTDDSGTVTATFGDIIVISVTNDCGTEGITITSDALDCPDTPCSNPAISISGTDCATDGSAFYTVSFTASAGTTVTSTLGDVNVSEGTITNIPSGENVTITATLEDCTESQSTEITAPMCPECVLPMLTVGTTECEGTTYAVSFNSNGTVTSNVGTVGTDSITNIPLGTDVIITSTTGDCSVSVTTTGLADPCDPDCNDLPGLVTGQPICGADGEYVVNYTVEDSNAVVTITGGTDDSGTVTATLGDTIVISVTNDCGTEGITITSDALNCPDTPCSNPAISISGTDCATDGSAFYTVSFTASAGTTVTSTLGDVNVSEGTITNIPSGENVTITATLENCVESQSVDITAPMCPECVLPILTVGTTECEGTTYAVDYISNGTVTVTSGGVSIPGVQVGNSQIIGIPLGTDVTITSSNGDCTVSIDVSSIDNPCDPDCNDLPGLVVGQPICGEDGEYIVSYSVVDQNATVNVTGAINNDSGIAIGVLGTEIVITVTNDCGTESMTMNSTDLNCPDDPCSNPAISLSGTDCSTNGEETYTVYFEVEPGTTVIALGTISGLQTGIVNTVDGTVTGIPFGEAVTIIASMDDCVTSQSIEVQSPTCSSMSLEKRDEYVDANGDGVVNAGDVINYTFIVTNTGNVDLYNITINDPLLVAPNGSISGGPLDLLIAGQNNEVTFTGTYTITEDDVNNGSVTNSATVTGATIDEVIITDTSDDPDDLTNVDENGDGEPDDPTVTVLNSGTLSLIKEITSITNVDGEEVENPTAGDIITYSFTVTNTGNIDLTNITIVDELLGDDLMGGPIALLEVDDFDSDTFTGTYIITDEDLTTGYVENTATVTGTTSEGVTITDVSDNGTDSDGDPITNPESIETPNGTGGTDGDPTNDPTVLLFNYVDLAVNKISNIADGVPGDEVIFTITVTNNSLINATGVEITENIPAGFDYVSHSVDFGIFVPENEDGEGIWAINTIFAGQTVTLTITTIATDLAEYTNTALLSGLDQVDTNVDDNSSAVTVGIVGGVEDGCPIYNEFSPNGDGVNDFFEIECIDEYPNNTLEIYNRWGNIVYKQNAYKNDWDGTSNGRSTVNKSEKLPVGTYYYVLDYGDGVTEKRAGWLYINR